MSHRVKAAVAVVVSLALGALLSAGIGRVAQNAAVQNAQVSLPAQTGMGGPRG